MTKIMLITGLLMFIIPVGFAQEQPVDTLKTDSVQYAADTPAAISTQYDIGDLIKTICHKEKSKPGEKVSGITVIPNISSNPTIGFQLGIKAVVGRKLGTAPNTLMSVAATSASATTKGIINFYITHNVYTNANKWNFQGAIFIAKAVVPDFGLGIGNEAHTSSDDKILSNPQRQERVLNAMYYTFREKAYKEIAPNFLIGAGVSFEIKRNIEDRVPTTGPTPYTIYSDRYGYNRNGYSSNGLLFNIQYTTRDNLNRAFKGFYADAGLRMNQTWMGSSKNALMFTGDFRKYISLSHRRPEHVVAFWNWGSYILSGTLPYLELPGTAKDGAFRSGRGYKAGYFKGTQYNYSEMEYRFPVTANGFLSGVAFVNMQTANDEWGTKLFQQFQPGYGAGVRILFNKHTRTNLCLDYAFGKYGQRGFFLSLNETF
jgi:Omp85 superfamily domain